MKIDSDTCAVEGCDRPRGLHSNGRGRYRYCTAHQARKNKFGDVGSVEIRPRSTDPFISAGNYYSVHMKVAKKRGLATEHRCVRCSEWAHEWGYSGGDPNEKTQLINGYLMPYSPDIRFYEPLCRRCHRRLDKGLQLEPPVCAFDGCESGTNARGLCGKHYQLLRRRGELPPIGSGI
jgi:hypothetical protein